MMTHRLYKRHGRYLHQAVSLLFGLHLLLFHVGLPGYVLCLGSDGHVAVERAADGASCTEYDVASEAAHAETAADLRADAGGDHCGDCHDLSLKSDCGDEPARLTERVATGHLAAAALSATLPDAGPIAPDPQRIAGFHGDSFPSPSLRSLRTTVLLN